MSKTIVEKNGEWNVAADDRGGCRYLFEDTCMNSFCPAYTKEVRISNECRICRFYRPEGESESPDLIDRNELIALFEHIKEELRSEKDWIYPLEIPVLTDLVTNMPSAYRLDETIKLLEALAEEHPYKVPGNPDTYNQYNEAWQDCIGRAINIVKGGGAE